MRVVLNTNLLVSALISPSGVPDHLYRAWRDHRFALISSEQQLDEFRRVTRYPSVRKFIRPATAGAMCHELRRLAIVVTALPIVQLSRDPADDYLLAMAMSGAADYLVTGDKRDLLALKRVARTRIVTARQLLTALGKNRN